MASQQSVSFIEQREGQFWVNALIGAVLTVVLSFIPLSPLLGGGVAAYLNRGTRMAGAKIGAISGLLAAVPAFLLITTVFGSIGFGVLFQVGAGGTAFFWAIMLFSLFMVAIVATGLGAVGGYIGAVLGERTTTEDPIHRQSDTAREADLEVETTK